MYAESIKTEIPSYTNKIEKFKTMRINSRTIKKCLIALIILLIIYFFSRFILINLTKVNWQEIKIETNLLIISILLLVASSFAGGFAWVKNLSTLGSKINFWQGIKVIAFAQFGKYIPGKVWSVGGRIILLKRLGVDEIQSSLAILIEAICLFLSAMVIFLSSLGFYGKETIPQRVYISFLFIPLSLILLHPKILKRLIALGIRLRMRGQGKALSEQLSTANFQLSIRQIVYLYLLYFFSWFIHTAGFFFLTKSIYPSANNFLGIIGAFSLSWALSFAVIFLPGGLGMREGILTFFLKFFLPLPIAALMSLIGRLWTTLGEIVIFIIALLIKGKKNER
ncbi:MAG: flippase-like domain-containing protein [candidate division WOR-3 bacterium]|nr:flippase-like domain-containing protein [candidate division WOR-3 bacterium]